MDSSCNGFIKIPDANHCHAISYFLIITMAFSNVFCSLLVLLVQLLHGTFRWLCLLRRCVKPGLLHFHYKMRHNLEFRVQCFCEQKTCLRHDYHVNMTLVSHVCQVGPALACGCMVVLEPSELTPLIAFAAAGLALEAGIPSVMNIISI